MIQHYNEKETLRKTYRILKWLVKNKVCSIGQIFKAINHTHSNKVLGNEKEQLLHDLIREGFIIFFNRNKIEHEFGNFNMAVKDYQNYLNTKLKITFKGQWKYNILKQIFKN